MPHFKRCLSTGVDLRTVMRRVPSPVSIVTIKNQTEQRGTTCGSFTSVSLSPPIISFSLGIPSTTSNLLASSDYFGVHILHERQVAHSTHFSSFKTQTDFTPFPHYIDPDTQVPVLKHCLAGFICKRLDQSIMGDHQVWYGQVMKITDVLPNDGPGALLYYQRSYRGVGDEVFMKAFEETSLSIQQWTHKAHLRMAWNYLHQTNLHFEEALKLIRQGIQRYNTTHAHLLVHGYNETITQVYTHLVYRALYHTPKTMDFDQFLAKNPHLEDPQLLFKYYTRERLYSEEAKQGQVVFVVNFNS